MPEHPAGGHEARDWKVPGADPDRDIRDRIRQAVGEEAGTPGRGTGGTANSRFQTRQCLGPQGRVGFGDVISDPEGAVQLVEGWRSETGIGGGSDPNPRGQLLADPGPETPGHARGIWSCRVQDQSSGGKVALPPDGVRLAPGIKAGAQGDDLAGGIMARLQVDAPNRGSAAALPATGEAATLIPETFVRPAFGKPCICTELPGPVARGDAPGRIQPNTVGRRRVLVRRRRCCEPAGADAG